MHLPPPATVAEDSNPILDTLARMTDEIQDLYDQAVTQQQTAPNDGIKAAWGVLIRQLGDTLVVAQMMQRHPDLPK